jgi:hypothetical protein
MSSIRPGLVTDSGAVCQWPKVSWRLSQTAFTCQIGAGSAYSAMAIHQRKFDKAAPAILLKRCFNRRKSSTDRERYLRKKLGRMNRFIQQSEVMTLIASVRK